MISPEFKYSATKPFHSQSLTGSGPEPMVMGSPTSPGQTSLNSSHSQYLPGFLLGDNTPTAPPMIHSHLSSSRLWSGSTSSSKLPNMSGASIQPSQTFNSSKRFTDRTEELPATRSKDKLSAPPVSGLLDTSVSTPQLQSQNSFIQHSLMDSFDTSQHPLSAGISSPTTPARHHSQFLAQVSHSMPAVITTTAIGGQNLNSSQIGQQSPAQIDPFYTQGEELSPHDILDETWVTIFGFAQGAAGYVLQQFSEYGTILQHVISNDGNWMHLHYQSKIAAKKALSKNGKVIGNNMMVGVTQCIDKAAMRGDTPDNCTKDESISLYSVQHTLPLKSKNLVASSDSCHTSTPIRSLTRAYESSSVNKENLHNDDDNKGAWWKKAMEYAFGW